MEVKSLHCVALNVVVVKPTNANLEVKSIGAKENVLEAEQISNKFYL